MSNPQPIGPIAEEWLDAQKGKLDLLPDPSPDELAHQESEARIAADAEKQQRRLKRAIEVYGAPLRHAQQVLFGEVEDCDALDIVSRWRAKCIRGSLLVLGGLVDSGKTLAAAKLVMDGPPLDYLGSAWPDAWHPRFIDAGDLHELGLYNREGGYAELSRCSVLVIDDISTEFIDKKGVMTSILNRVLNKRYSGAGWTLVTTNLSPGDFSERYGERLWSRLHDEGCGFVRAKGQFRERTTT